jgi:hypothetical protein
MPSHTPQWVFFDTGARPENKKRKQKRKTVNVIYPTGIIVDVGVEVPKSVSNFRFSGFRILRQTGA